MAVIFSDNFKAKNINVKVVGAQVLNVVASVTMKDVEFYRLAGGEYRKADAKLVEFTEA